MSTDDPMTGTDEELGTILDGTYTCGRVWEAWEYGTMTEADFAPAAESDVAADLIAWRDAAVAGEQERIIAMLERAAAGRREYAGPESNQSEASVLLRKGAAWHEFDVKLIRDPTLMLDIIPSWRWTAEEEASIREVPDA